MEVDEWLDEIKDAEEREDDFRKEGEEIEEIFEGENPDEYPFNILYSNTEILVPALYSQTPRPVVKRRHNKNDSPLIQAVEKAGTLMLEYLLDTNMDMYEKFDDSMTDAVKDAALPGRGVTQVKFDAEIDGEDVKYATVCTESRKWNKVHFGYAEKWSKVPWLAFEEYLTKEEAEELIGDLSKFEIEYTENEDEDDEGETVNTGNKTAKFFQIWDKNNKEVVYICDQCDSALKTDDDPLEISGFFPVPKPLYLLRKSNNLVPTALYTIYRNQAKELNRITTRLNRVIEAIKVRGVYDGQLGAELDELMEGDDNELIAAENGAALVEGGFDKAIWFMPIEKLIIVARSLMDAREQTKSVIYEITGISDIIRGSSKASETLGAQKIKETWGTMRLKNMQKDVQKYVRNTLRIMLDIASLKVPEKFWPEFTGLSFPTQEQKASAIAQLEDFKRQRPDAMTMGNMPPQELIQAAQSPSWTEILDVLKDDLSRSYLVDIETNSTIDIEATEDKEQVAEFMNAISQFMNGITPMIEKGIMPFGAAKSMLLEITRRFRFGIDVENEIKSMQEPKNGDPEKMKQEFEKKAKELQAAQKKQQQLQEKFDSERERVGKELDQKDIDLQTREMKFEVEQEKFKYEKKMAEMVQKSSEVLAMEKVKLQDEKQSIELDARLEKTKRDIQSMMDKQAANLEKIISSAKPEGKESAPV